MPDVKLPQRTFGDVVRNNPFVHQVLKHGGRLEDAWESETIRKEAK